MNNQEVPQGYKKTKVGVIPEEWEAIKLKDILAKDIQNGYSPICPENETGHWILGLGALLKDTKLNIYDRKPAPINDDKVKQFILKNNDFLISRANTPERVGYCGVFRSNEDNYSYPDLMMRFRISEKSIDIDFLENYLKSFRVLRYLQLSAAGSSSSMVKINKKVVENINIIQPPMKEQQKIAKILTTWDDAIFKQEKLIKAKEQLKKGLMQKLLSGEVRFDGFSEEWKSVYLGEIATITTGSSNREDSTEYDGEFTFFDRSEDIRTSNRYLFEGEAIIIAGEGQRFIPKYFVGKFDLHQRTYVIMNFKNSIGKYLFYYIWQYNNYFLVQAVGSTVKSLRLPMFEKMKIKLPPLQEQQKIAQVLSTADKEIELLKNELESLKEQKKGLMQRLLTGEVRV